MSRALDQVASMQLGIAPAIFLPRYKFGSVTDKPSLTKRKSQPPTNQRSAAPPSMDRSLLRKLPPELRLDIRDLVLFPGEGVRVDITGDTPHVQELAITQVCSKIRSECRSIQDFWTRNDFVILVSPKMQRVSWLPTGNHLPDGTVIVTLDEAELKKKIAKLDKVLRRLPAGFQHRGQRLQLHLGTWDVKPWDALEILKPTGGVVDELRPKI